MPYLSTADINSFLGINGEDVLVSVINANAEAVLNNLIGTTGLAEASYTELVNYPTITEDGNYSGRILYLKQINPTLVTQIDSVSVTVNTDYILTGNKLFLEKSLTYKSTFPFKNSIAYTAGYTTIPADIKHAMYIIVGAMYNSKTAQGISSFRQDLLSVNYDTSGGVLNTIMNPWNMGIISGIINKYKVPYIFSTGINRTQL